MESLPRIFLKFSRNAERRRKGFSRIGEKFPENFRAVAAVRLMWLCRGLWVWLDMGGEHKRLCDVLRGLYGKP